MHTNYDQYYPYIKKKFDASQINYKKIFTTNDTPDDFFFTYESMNVYPTFPSPIILSLKNKNDVFNPTLEFKIENNIIQYENMLKSKMKEYAHNLKKIINLADSEKIRRYFDYEIRDVLKKKYNIPHITNAWIKMYELLITYNLFSDDNPNEILTMHICEHPGKFIFAIKDFIKNKLSDSPHKFVFQSLNPTKNKAGFKVDPELKNDSSGILDYGKNSTGDITNIDNINHYIKTYSDKNFKLITSDCGEDFSDDFTLQEMGLYKIYLSALVTSIGLSKPGTNYIFKLFSFSNIKTIELLYIACMFYESVDIVRVMTTKGNSSEIYCVCQNYNYDKNNKILDKLINYINDQSVSFVKLYDKAFIERIIKYHHLLTIRRITSINQLLFRLFNDDYTKSNNVIISTIKLYVDYYTNYFIKYIGFT